MLYQLIALRHPPTVSPIRQWGRTVARLIVAVYVSTLLSLNVTADERQQQIDVDTFDQFDAAFRCDAIDLLSVSNSVRLVPMEVHRPSVAYAMAYRTVEPGAEGRIDFDLTNAAPDAGELLIYGHGAHVLVNDRKLPLTPLPPGGWVRTDIPAGLLREGLNQVRLPEGFRIGVDPEAIPSAFSFLRPSADADWQALDGEYIARLRVFRYPPHGVITADVIDVVNPGSSHRIAPLAEVTALALSVRAHQPRGTAVTLETRSGPSHRPDADWTDWSPTLAPEPNRYLQWRARLSSRRPDRTPELQRVRIEATLRPIADAGDHGYRVVEWDAPPIVRGSYRFTFQEPSPKLERLRRDWALDDVIDGAPTQLDAFIQLRNWVRNQWPHNDGGARDRTWDAIDILTAPEGQKGMCSHFGVLFTQSALALGFVSRHIILNGHFVADIWSDDLRQWILMDVEAVQTEGWKRYGTALYRDAATDRPLDVLDLHRAFLTQTTTNIVQALAMHDDTGIHRVYPRRYGLEGYANFKRFALPDRNNYLDQLEPWEQSWGFNHYFSDAFLWWRNEPRGHTPQFSWLTDREGDIRWHVNTTALTLTCLPQTDTLSVRLDTVTPNFAVFLIRRNHGDWEPLEAPGPDPHERQARWTWPLQPGRNQLDVRARNQFGRDGAISHVVIDVNQP